MSFRNWVSDLFSSKESNPLFFEYFSNWISGATPEFNDYSKDILKQKATFTNPALLKVIALQCDLFSLGKFYVYQGETKIDSDPLLDQLDKPNIFQSKQQFLWDYMFWKMLGNAYLYIDSRNPTGTNIFSFLQNDKMEFPIEFRKWQDKIVFSKASEKTIKELKIRYIYENGEYDNLPWSNIVHFADLTNGNGNWFKGPSRIDSLKKVISNSEAALDSKNINIRWTSKWIATGKAGIDELPLGETEKKDVENKLLGNKMIHATKATVDLKRFVSDMASLQLDQAYLADYFLIGTHFGIPRDVLEAYQSSTFENQEKARGAHVSYTLEPAAEMFCSSISSFFGYTNKKLVLSWDHLPFTQVFEKDRATVDQIKSQTILNLQVAGASLEDINKFLDTDFKELKKYEQPKQPEQQVPTAGSTNLPNQGSDKQVN